jgi:hypothetical protein
MLITPCPPHFTRKVRVQSCSLEKEASDWSLICLIIWSICEDIIGQVEGKNLHRHLHIMFTQLLGFLLFLPNFKAICQYTLCRNSNHPVTTLRRTAPMKTMMGQVPAHTPISFKTPLAQARQYPYGPVWTWNEVGTSKIVGARLCTTSQSTSVGFLAGTKLFSHQDRILQVLRRNQ